MRISTYFKIVYQWLTRRKKDRWPAAVLDFKGDPDFPRFESYRDDLLPPKEDPFENWRH